MQESKTNVAPSYQSLSALLRAHGIALSPRRANKILQEAGVLLCLIRPNFNMTNGYRRFYVLSSKGLDYGKNTPSPVHPTQTSPVYYSEAFPALVERYFTTRMRHLSPVA
ncbi:MAG: hypothetical protein COA42_04615 [Alteromonadaceae bacterium]|nr:MAG: hypothetical protein COA42_04615 [Alteromonadaceae bacterium]